MKENLDRKKTATDVGHLTKAKVRQVIFVETVIHVKEDFIDFFLENTFTNEANS